MTRTPGPDEAPSAHLPVAPGPMVPWAMAPLSPILNLSY